MLQPRPRLRRPATTRRPWTAHVEALETRALRAAANLFTPSASLYPSLPLQTPPVVQSRDGVLDATLTMITAGASTNPVLYGGQALYSTVTTPADPKTPPVYAMAYQVEANGQTLPAQYPAPILKIQPGETLQLHVKNQLQGPQDPTGLIFTTNLHAHGLEVSPLSQGDNVYRSIASGQSFDFTIKAPTWQDQGLNWYHVHRHGSTHDQVYGGLSGFIQVGDPLAAWPQYQQTLTQQYLALSQVNIQPGADGLDHLVPYQAGTTGATFTSGWQKRVNGQVNPTITLRPGETQVWNLGSIGALGSYNLAITDADLKNPWDATLLAQDGNSRFAQPRTLSLAADAGRMQDLDAATLIMPGNRLSLAVTAPTTPGTYYLIDGWGGQNQPALAKGQQQYYTLATLVVSGDPVTTPKPEFTPVQGIAPVFDATPDVRRTFVFTVGPNDAAGVPTFLINGQTFGQGPMPQLQIGTVEEWTLINQPTSNGSANHPFHIHQGNFVVTAINGVAVDRHSAAYVSPRDVINIPTKGSVTIRFRVTDNPGKYVFHCHILKHEDRGMMSAVLAFAPAGGIRLPIGGAGTSTVLDGRGTVLGQVRPFHPGYAGPIAGASALGASEAFETLALGTGTGSALVKVYRDGVLEPSARFQAFTDPRRSRGGVSVAVGDLSFDGAPDIAVGSRAPGPALVRLFDRQGQLLREFRDVLPGLFPTGVNVAVGDVNGDNFDDLIISAGRGREPIVTALDGRDIVLGATKPATLFTFVAGGGSRAGARVAAGYVAPGTVPSQAANLIVTPEAGPMAGTVAVWNTASLLGGHDAMHDPTMPSMPTDPMPGPPMPLVQFQPFAGSRRPLQLGANSQGTASTPGVPVVATWTTPRRVAFSAIDLANQVTTTVRNLSAPVTTVARDARLRG